MAAKGPNEEYWRLGTLLGPHAPAMILTSSVSH